MGCCYPRVSDLLANGFLGLAFRIVIKSTQRSKRFYAALDNCYIKNGVSKHD